MVIGYFDRIDTVISPTKTKPVLAIDPDGMMACAVMGKGVQLVTGWHLKVVEGDGGIKVAEFAPRGGKDGVGQGFGNTSRVASSANPLITASPV